jgi:hypothetical protein
MSEIRRFATDYNYECEACGCLLTDLKECQPHTDTHINDIAGFTKQFGSSPISMPIMFKTILKEAN